ncbi:MULTISPECIES: hypothetical protein [Vibrio]|uniref:Uncharacterized protein n=1 Tax=Vibrio casei TaxID=673372 RepID=A0A368LJT3_9VIBR|nr:MULTISPECIES: hypothetical protein [Vibrio]RCS70896.1 hypothetical protein CIK83_16035 [Vibrio casei]SJN40299.1 hypothetical protein FM109_16980 [Vibrio casei]HBV76683.1 hypothetical protein [Vibrio sp.]
MTLIAIVLSSVSVATPISAIQMTMPQATDQSMTHDTAVEPDSQHHASPCASLSKTGLVADFPCSDFAKHSDDHCASCAPIYATLPTALDMESNPSAESEYNDHTESIPSLTLPNLSRPPIQSVWF